MADGHSTRGGIRRASFIAAALAGIGAGIGSLLGVDPGAVTTDHAFPRRLGAGAFGRSRRGEQRDRSLPKRAGQYEKRYRNTGSQRLGPKSNSPRGRSW